VSVIVNNDRGWLRVHFARGHADFHLRWLRHNCDLDRHPQTAERTVDSSELPDALSAEATIDGDELSVRWAHDGRVSRYALPWLEENAYARDRRELPPPSDVARIEIAGEGLSLEQRVQRALANLAEHGAAVVRAGSNDGPPEGSTERIVDAFSAAGLDVIGTHFGRIEDLRTDNTTNQNTDQLGYTSSAVDLHTDQPFLANPPRLQLLQSIRAADVGGENYVVDAFAAAGYLASFDAESEAILRATPVRFHRKQKSFEKLHVSPILERDRVRYSYFTMAPHRLPFERMEAFYRAYDRFARLVRDPRHQYRFALAPGDFLLYDNHRMLHARTAFSGPRWVRGIYFDHRAR
jgi:gamma-butyrobetaine dioxygenase/trimethyllysine dioxygenase